MTALTISRSQSAQRSSKRDGTSPRGHPPSTPNPDTPKHLGPELGILPGLASPIRLNPSASLNDQARSFLYARFVNETPQTLDPGYHYVLRAIFELEDTGDCLDACVSAAALAAFTTRPDAKGVDIRTHKAYLRALSAINTAIQEPDAAGDDRILASVLMLAFYEVGRSDLPRQRKRCEDRGLTGQTDIPFQPPGRVLQSHLRRGVHDKCTERARRPESSHPALIPSGQI